MGAVSLSEVSVDQPAEDVILDGSAPPAQTIIFENTSFRGGNLSKDRGTPPSKSKAPAPAQKQEKPAKTEAVQVAALAAATDKEEMLRERALGISDGSFTKAPPRSAGDGAFSSGSGLQLAVGISKGPVSSRSAVQRIQHMTNVHSPTSPSTADLNMKIVSVKKLRLELVGAGTG